VKYKSNTNTGITFKLNSPIFKNENLPLSPKINVKRSKRINENSKFFFEIKII